MVHRGGRSLLQGGSVYVEPCLHLLFPSIPTRWECKPSLIPCKHQSHPLCNVQHFSTFHQWTVSFNGTVPFCAAQPLEGWDRRGERQAVKQFPPSESHSNPHTGDWGLTPARRWHKHRQTKDLSSEQVWILEDPNLQKADCDLWVRDDGNRDCRFEEIKLWRFHGKFYCFFANKGRRLFFFNWFNNAALVYKDTFQKQLTVKADAEEEQV